MSIARPLFTGLRDSSRMFSRFAPSASSAPKRPTFQRRNQAGLIDLRDSPAGPLPGRLPLRCPTAASRRNSSPPFLRIPLTIKILVHLAVKVNCVAHYKHVGLNGYK